jgi:hypothetical protein
MAVGDPTARLRILAECASLPAITANSARLKTSTVRKWRQPTPSDIDDIRFAPAAGVGPLD